MYCTILEATRYKAVLEGRQRACPHVFKPKFQVTKEYQQAVYEDCSKMVSQGRLGFCLD